MFYHFKVQKEDGGYFAECIELRGCQSQGSSMNELKANLDEALNLFLSEPMDSKLIFPRPKRAIRARNVIQVRVQPNVAFSMMLRQARLKLGLTQKQAADRLNIKSLYTYQKLEKAKTSNPGLFTLEKIKRVFSDIDINEAIGS